MLMVAFHVLGRFVRAEATSDVAISNSAGTVDAVRGSWGSPCAIA